MWTPGDVSGLQALTDSDHLYPVLFNELRKGTPNWYNVSYYGSGTTHVEIQAALDAAHAAGGGVVYIPAGTWTIDTPLIVYDYTTIIGDGNATIIKLDNGMNENGNLYYGYSGGIKSHTAHNYPPGAVDICLFNFKIDGNGATMTTDNEGAISMQAMSGLRIQNVEVINNKGYAGMFLQSYNPAPYTTDGNFVVRDCKITGCSRAGATDYGCGIYFTAYGFGSHLVDNQIEDCSGAGIWLEDHVAGVVVSGNIIRDLTTAYGNGIRATYADHCIISNNRIYDCTASGMNLGAFEKGTIVGNIVQDNGGHGIILSGSQNTANGNVIFNNAHVSANYSGIYLANGSTYNVITGNRIFDDQTPKTQAYAIQEQGVTADYNFFANNSVSGNLTGGILKLGANSTVRNNPGHVTEASGTGSIASGTTADIITHGLSVTPTVDDIVVTLAEDPTSTPGAIWVGTIGATYFTVNCENNPGASNLDFGWKAVVL